MINLEYSRIVSCRWQPEGMEAQPPLLRPQTLEQADPANADFNADDSGLDTTFDPRPDQQGLTASRPAIPSRLESRSKTAARLNIPELLDETGPFFDDSAHQPTLRARKVAFLSCYSCYIYLFQDCRTVRSNAMYPPN